MLAVLHAATVASPPISPPSPPTSGALGGAVISTIESLRVAINAAAIDGRQSSELRLGPVWFNLGGSELTVATNLTVGGTRESVLDAQSLSRVFQVMDGGRLTLAGVTLIGGNAPHDSGGALLVTGIHSSVHLTSVLIRNSSSLRGGGVAVERGDKRLPSKIRQSTSLFSCRQEKAPLTDKAARLPLFSRGRADGNRLSNRRLLGRLTSRDGVRGRSSGARPGRHDDVRIAPRLHPCTYYLLLHSTLLHSKQRCSRGLTTYYLLLTTYYLPYILGQVGMMTSTSLLDCTFVRCTATVPDIGAYGGALSIGIVISPAVEVRKALLP